MPGEHSFFESEMRAATATARAARRAPWLLLLLAGAVAAPDAHAVALPTASHDECARRAALAATIAACAGAAEVPPSSILCRADGPRSSSLHALLGAAGCSTSARASPTLSVRLAGAVSARAVAYVRARELAACAKRTLVVAWDRDVECAAGFGELFERSSDVLVLEYRLLSALLGNAARMEMGASVPSTCRALASPPHEQQRHIRLLGAGRAEQRLKVSRLQPALSVQKLVLSTKKRIRAALGMSASPLSLLPILAVRLPAREPPTASSDAVRQAAAAMASACNGTRCAFFVAAESIAQLLALRRQFVLLAQPGAHDVLSVSEWALWSCARGDGVRCAQLALANEILLARTSAVLEWRDAPPLPAREADSSPPPPALPLVSPEEEGGREADGVRGSASAVAEADATRTSCEQWRAEVLECSRGQLAPAASLCDSGSALPPRARAAYLELARAMFGRGAPGARPRKTIVVHAMHGTSNRLRALAAAQALATHTGRLLALIWESDVHCASGFGELFEIPDGLLVLERFDESLFPAAAFRRYNYMAAASGGGEKPPSPNGTTGSSSSWWVRGKYQLIRDAATDHKHIYVRSAYTLNTQSAGNFRRPLFAQRLAGALGLLVPTAPVRALVAAAADRMRTAQNQSVIGVHVRMVTDVQRDVPGVESVRDDAELGVGTILGALRYRKACHWSAFADAMEAACGGGAACAFYVASDDLAAIEALRQRLVGAARRHELFSLSPAELRSCSDSSRAGSSLSRGTRCQQVALADQLLLARSAYLLTSTWSSFSELVLMWNPTLIPRMRSGCGSVTS